MKRGRTEAARQKLEHSLWYGILTVALPVFSLMLSASLLLIVVVFSRVRREITIELGEESPAAGAFLRSGSDAVYDIPPETRYQTAGDYRLRVHTGAFSVPVTLRVRDTQAPTATGKEMTLSTREAPTPDRLLTDIRDKSVVKISFETAPRYGQVCDCEAVVLLEDMSGNQTRISVPVHIRAVKEEIIVEAGDPAPKAEAFLVDRYDEVEMTRITETMLREPGVYSIRFLADGAAAESTLIVQDTVPPEGRGVTFIAAPGQAIELSDLVADVRDETVVAASFLTAPDPDCRTEQTVTVLLTDRGGNSTTVDSTLLITGVKPKEIEAHSAPLTVSELDLSGSFTEAALSEPFVPDKPGAYVLSVLIDGQENVALLAVKDTTPPEIKLLKTEGMLDTPEAPDAFATVNDVTETSLTFSKEPDWSKEKQDVTLIASDAYGNTGERTFTLTLVPDTEPPVLFGVVDRTFEINETVTYLDGVSAVDNRDGAVAVSVDASAVNSAERGSYRVIYSVTDRAGNTAVQEAVFRFVTPRIEGDQAQEVADRILSEILTDNMTLAEQIEAIYDYVFRNVHYVARSSKKDWRSEAVRGLTKGKGDCFTSYAAARLLLEQTDAQVLPIERNNKKAHHYWLLVNIGTGWYHYDACRAWNGKRRCFMWTDAQTRRISKTYWRYDKSLYPEVATEPYNGGN